MESSGKNGNFFWVRALKRNVQTRTFKPFILLSAMILLLAGALSACGGGSGGGSSSGIVGSVILASQNSSGSYQLSTFPYTASGTIASGTPTATYSSFSGTPCSSGQILTGGYDKSYGLLFLYVQPASNTITICVFSVSTSGNISYTNNSLQSISDNNGITVNPIGHFLFANQSSGAPQLYSYNSAGVINSTPSTLSTSFNGTTYNFVSGDFVNSLGWGCQGTAQCSTISVAANFSSTFDSITAINSTSSGPFVSSSNNFTSDTSNGVLINSTSNNSSCSSSTSLGVLSWTYTKSTGVLGTPSAPLSVSGGCYLVGDTNNNGTDNSDKMFFIEGNTSIYPVLYTTSNPPVLTQGNSVTMPSGSTGAVVDLTNHLLATGISSSGSLTNILMGPYTSSGIGNGVTSPSLNLGNYSSQPTCSSGSNCTQPIFALIN